MGKTTFETRRESYDEVLETLGERHRLVLDELAEAPGTAREIALRLWEKGRIPAPERNYTAPRLTELSDVGVVAAVEKTTCRVTGKTVAVYAIAAPPEKAQGELEL